MNSTASTSAAEAASAFLDALRALLGDAHVLTPDGHDLSAYERDWRKRYVGRALAVARPADTAQVVAVVALAREHRIALVPQGGNTGLVGGGVPDGSGAQLLLSLQRLNRVRHIDAANLTMTVEAGCVLQNVQQAARDAGLLFPLSLAAEGSCTIGGNLATNAGGTQVLRYGNARELCLGLEIVTADGQIWDGLSGLRKDNTGYDLRDLFIGSEGTLGVITAATLKLHPQPRARMTALAACESLGHAVALLGHAQSRCGAALTGFEVMNALSLALVAKHFPQLAQPLGPQPWTVLLELSDSESEAHAREQFEGLLEQAMELDVIVDAAVAESLAQSQAMWHLRESIPLAQSEEGLNIKHDIALPVSRIPAFVARCDALLAERFPGSRLVDFGHLGDGNLHYNVQAPEGVAAADFLREHEPAVNALVYDQVMAHGGSISAEHGIGQLKREELAQRKSPVALQLMRQIKQALDPQGLLNPNRVI
jgi:FAD/FMN-containing dehydrogenase